jgi:CBS domain-containing protein
MCKRGLPGLIQRMFSPARKYDNPYHELMVLRIRDVMSRDVMCIRPEERLVDAAHIMIGAHVSCLVVVTKDNPVGIITERDFIKKLNMGKEEHEVLLVSDLMTKKLVTAESGSDLVEAQKIMRQNHFRKIVVAHNNELKGIVTQTDLCRAVAGLRTPIIGAPLVKDVMTRKVLSVACDEQFPKIKKLMAQKDIGSVLVLEKDKACGIFTEFDLVSEFFMNPNKLHHSHMHELGSKPIICISPDFDLVFVNKLMLGHNFRRLPVMENDNIIGIITQTDVAREIYKFIEQKKDAHNPSGARNIDPGYDVIKKENAILFKKKEEKKEGKKPEEPSAEKKKK